MNYPHQNLSLEDMEGESWVAIPNFEALYQVSNLGRVRRLQAKSKDKRGYNWLRQEMMMKPVITKAFNAQTGDSVNFARITLSKDKKQFIFSLARLVYNSFVAPFDIYDRKLFVFSKDGDNLNLNASNLILGTPKDKVTRMIAAGRRKVFFEPVAEAEIKKRQEKINAIKKENGTYNISRYSLTGKLLETYPNAKVAAAAMKIFQGHLSAAARKSGKILTAHGYIWRRGKATEIDIQPLLKERWYGCSPLAKQQARIGQYDLEGNLINTYSSTVEAAKAVGAHKNNIRKVTSNRGLTCGGFIWSKTIKKKIQVNPKIKSSRIVSQYDLDGKWIKTYKNAMEASSITGVEEGSIYNVVNNNALTAGGFLWRKGEDLRININELRRHPHYSRSGLQKHMKKKRNTSIEA